VRLLDEPSTPLRQALEQLAYAALRDALAHAPERAQSHLEMLRRHLDSVASAALSGGDRALMEEALAPLVPSPR
jgi:hypothetical protein